MLANLPQTSRNLLAAAEYLRENGWLQNEWQNGRARCVQGAIWEVSPRGTGSETGCALARFLGGTDGLSNIGWNNTPGRTADEVISALESAAARAAQEALW